MFVYLLLAVVILFAVYCFKLTAIYSNGGFARQIGFTQKLYIQPEHRLQRLCMQFSKIGNGMIIRAQVLQQPLQLYIADALPFQLSAAAYFI